VGQLLASRLAPPILSVAVLVGAFIVVAIAIGVAHAAAWVGFGISLATALAGVILVAVARRHRLRALAWVGSAITGLAGWTVVATAGIFSAGTERWIAFASGLGYIVAALGALGIHEASSSRVVHVLEVRGDPART
jgi:hypothetical protein